MRPIKDIKRDALATLGGPWTVERSSVSTRVLDADGMIVCSGPAPATLDEPDHEATFIAHARTDVPELCAEVELLRALLDDVRDDIAAYVLPSNPSSKLRRLDARIVSVLRGEPLSLADCGTPEQVREAQRFTLEHVRWYGPLLDVEHLTGAVLDLIKERDEARAERDRTVTEVLESGQRARRPMSNLTHERRREIREQAKSSRTAPLLAEAVLELLNDIETCDGSCDIALARRQVGPDGYVPGSAKECAEMWEREASRLRAELQAANVRAQRAERACDEWHDESITTSSLILAVADALGVEIRGVPEHRVRDLIALEPSLARRCRDLSARALRMIEEVNARATALDRDIEKDERYIGEPGSIGHGTLKFKNGYLRQIATQLRAIADRASHANQCDGCARGLPIVEGVHRGAGYDMIACTASDYRTTP